MHGIAQRLCLIIVISQNSVVRLIHLKGQYMGMHLFNLFFVS